MFGSDWCCWLARGMFGSDWCWLARGMFVTKLFGLSQNLQFMKPNDTAFIYSIDCTFSNCL
jgi:hypothetical protein